MGFRVGDKLSLAILGLCCGGTFIGLALTSIAKHNGQTGPPEKPDWPWLQDAEAKFEQRMAQLNAGSTGGTAGGAGGGGNSSGGGSSSSSGGDGGSGAS